MTASGTRRDALVQDLEHVLTHAAASFEALRGESIFITGGTGFFGRWLLESFAYANARMGLGSTVVVLSRDPEAFRRKAPLLAADPSIHFVAGDVRTFTAADVRAQLRTPDGFRFVIHAATEASAKLNAEDPLRMVDTVVQGTRAALEFAVAVGAERFLLTSSGAVYGSQPPDLTHVPEEYLGSPDCLHVGSAYAEGKRLAELLCACYAKQFSLQPLIARCFAFVGPFLPLDTHFAIGNFIRDALDGGPIRVGGDGTPERSYLYAADLAIWLWTILVNGRAMRAYNVGSEDNRSIRAIASAVAQGGGSLPVVVARAADPAQPTQRYVPSCRRVREELQLHQRIDLDESIARTLRFLRCPAEP